MTSSKSAQVPQRLVAEGVSVICTGTMGAAYAARLSALGVPVTVFNRTASKAKEVARAHRNVKVADSLLDCARASPNLLVACAPTQAAVAAVCEQLAGAVRDKHVTFIVDSGLPQAQVMQEVLFDRGRAASVTNAALFGTAYAVMDGSGTLINASGKAVSADTVAERVLPLLGLFGAATYHQGGTATAAFFEMAGHVAYMPIFYGLMHYVALMSKSGVSSQVALDYFQATGKAVIDGFAPMLAPALDKRDYSLFLASHRLVKQIEDCLVQTCQTLEVDDRLPRLMSDYHDRAMKDPALADRSFHSVHEVICRASG